MKHQAQHVLRLRKPLCRCEAEESRRFCIVLRNTMTITKNLTQAVLSARTTLCRCTLQLRNGIGRGAVVPMALELSHRERLIMQSRLFFARAM
jgi:hypothetical protein